MKGETNMTGWRCRWFGHTYVQVATEIGQCKRCGRCESMELLMACFITPRKWWRNSLQRMKSVAQRINRGSNV